MVVKYMVASPAMDRLCWILDGLQGTAGWGGDAADVLAPEFAALLPPDRFAERVRQRAAALAPLAVTGFAAGDHTARADIRGRDASELVVTCTVQERAPHRITFARTMALIPPFLAPRLPADFTGDPRLAGRGADARLIVVCGLPGTGKSTLADAIGGELRIPVFAGDWLLGSLTPFGGYQRDRLMESGTELLTTLAFRQLRAGQSAILDFPGEDEAIRDRWRTLAGAAGAEFLVLLCICSDRKVHRARLERRERGIPGWHEGGDWANVERRLARFPPWEGEVLTIDAVRPFEENLAAVLYYLAGGRRPGAGRLSAG